MESPKRRKDGNACGLLSTPEMNVENKSKDYPSISDYYKAAASGTKPIQYQHGLSNYSSVQLGDDRVSFKTSLSQDAYRDNMDRASDNGDSAENKDGNNDKIEKTYKERKAEYADANSIVGIDKIHEMEQMMRDKLQQRTKTGPFQLRKTFKYFDRDGSGGIDFGEFQRAMDLMGFQFSDIQLLALFARYDDSCTGEVDYNEFVEKVMESDFKKIVPSQKNSLNKLVSSAFGSNGIGADGGEQILADDEDSDMDEEELEEFRRTEVRKLFDLIDRDDSQSIERSEVGMLLKALGRSDVNQSAIEAGFQRLDTDNSGRIEWEEFYAMFRGGGRN
jgi:Ca2+-binding EF-hand superfamily protein